jgi:hypothetical protein
MRMRSLEQILQEKETELARVRQQVEALRFVAPMLVELKDSSPTLTDRSQNAGGQRNRWPLDIS